MKYNKNIFDKVNEKKILKKVKKQWVVASVTTLALMGMTAFSLNVSNVTVKADDVSATQSKQNSDNTSEDQGASAATNSMAAQSGADSTYIDAYNGATAAKSAYDNYAKSNGTSSYYPEYNSQGDSTTSSKDTNVENGGQNEESGQPENNKPVDNTTETSQTKNADYATQTSAAQASATSYERSLTSSANSNNASVSLAEGKVSVPTSDSTKDGSTNAYKYGANYFLASQGATDARTGKWNGYYYDKDGNKQLSSYAPDSTSSNAYDQGYLGAQYAIRQQFNQDDSINSSLSAADVSKNSQYYQVAYDETFKQIQSGTAFVGNETEFNSAISNGRKSVKLINDVNIKSDNTFNISNLDIDGQNHIIDMNNINDKFSGNNPNLTVQNFRTIYAQNYYGAFSINGSGTINYKNVNYIGSQMLSAGLNDVYFDGNINAINVKSYTSPFNNNVATNGDNQQILDVKDFTLMPNAHFFGATAKTNGGDNIELSGNMILSQNSSMNLVARGNSGENAPAGDYAVYLKNGSSNLTLQKGAQLNIIPTTSDNDTNNNANAIYNLGSIYNNGGQINIEANGNSQNNNRLIYNQKDIKVTNNGSINVHLANLGNNTSDGIIYNDGGTIYIVDQGNMSISADGSGKVNLIKGNLNINNPGSQGVHLDLSQNGRTDSTFHDNNSIVAYSTKVDFNGNTENGPLYKFKYDGSNVNYVKVDGINNTATPSTSIKSISFNGVPSVSMNNVSIDNDSNGKPILNGYVVINNYDGKDKTIYVQFASGSGNDYNQLTPLNSNTIGDKPTNDAQVYNLVIQIPNNYKSGDLIPIKDSSIPSLNNANDKSTGVLMRYGFTGSTYVYNNSDSTNPIYTRQVENIGLNNQLSADSTNDSNAKPYIDTQTGSYNDFRNGFNDGVADANNQNDDALTNRNAPVTDVDYHNAYDSAKAGYLAYIDNPIAKTDNIPDSVKEAGSSASHPKSYVNGYIKAMNDIDAAKQDGKKDATDYIVANTSATKPTDNSYTSQAKVNAYNDVQNGFNNAAVNKDNDNPNGSPIYNAAYKETKSGMQSAHNDWNTDSNVQGKVKLATLSDKAYNDFLDGLRKGTTDANNDSEADKQSNQSPVYKSAYADAKAGYQAYLGNPIYSQEVPASVTTDSKQTNNPDAYVDGYTQAMRDIDAARAKGQASAIKDIDSNNYGLKNDNLTTATAKAQQQAFNDVKNGWLLGKQNARNNVGNDNYGDNPIYRDAYKNGYNGTMDSYQDVLNEHTRNISNQPDLYQDAYKLANPDALNDKNAALNDFKQNVNKSKDYSGMDKVVYDHFYPVVNDYYMPMQNKRNGFKDAIDKLTNMDPDSIKYNDDYKLGINMLAGMKAAQSENNLTEFERHSKPLGYVDGFDGYKAGYKLGASGINYSKANKNKAYDYAYAKGFIAGQKDISKVAVNEARKQAKRLKPMLNLDNRSATFINAYEKAYKQAISKLLPGYIYNRRAIYTHSKADSNKNSQVSKYDKKSRVHAKVFKVIGYKFNKAGNLYYKLSNGNYVAADNSIANLYYTKLGVSKKYKVISKNGIKSYHDDALSNQNGKLGYNHIFKADRIVKIGNVTRIHLVDGSYVTGNKKFVNIITK